MLKNEIIEKAKESHSNELFNSLDFSLIEENHSYKSHDKINLICLKHNITFSPKLRLFINDSNCPICANEIRKEKNRKEIYKTNFIKLADIKHNGNYDYSLVNYINAKEKVDIICKNCGRVFKQSPNDHLNGRGCPYCRESKLEKEVEIILNENNIEYISQCNSRYFSWLNKLSFDFYLPKHRIAIECQGRQHFEIVKAFGGEEEYNNIVRRDLNKIKLCNENNIKLIYYSHCKYNILNGLDIISNPTHLIEKIFEYLINS